MPFRWCSDVSAAACETGLMADHVEDVRIRDESIRLGQFLKLANMIESGSDAKELMIQGAVTVNGEVETRRGRQLVPGDVVALGGVRSRVASL
jgi:ribosome-associated protein